MLFDPTKPFAEELARLQAAGKISTNLTATQRAAIEAFAAREPAVPVTHGLCPACYEKAMAELLGEQNKVAYIQSV